MRTSKMDSVIRRGMRRCTILLAVVFANCWMTVSHAGGDEFDLDKLRGRDNLEQTPVGSSGKWSLEKLLALSQAEGMQLWEASPAVQLQELHGHYMGFIPNGDDVAEQRKYAARYFSSAPTKYWFLGKAFRPVTTTEGEGYSRVRLSNGRILRVGDMKTHVGKSLIDGKDSYICDFSAQGIAMTDELRKLDDHVYLGASTVPAAGGGRKPAEPAFFVLIGPTDEWLGTNITWKEWTSMMNTNCKENEVCER